MDQRPGRCVQARRKDKDRGELTACAEPYRLSYHALLTVLKGQALHALRSLRFGDAFRNRGPIWLIAIAVVAVSSAGSGAAVRASALAVTITAAPAGTTTSTTATFEFSADGSASFDCSLDGAVATPCTSPVSYSGLADGAHTFTVTARGTGPRGAPELAQATRRWTIERARAQLVVAVEGGGSVLSSPAGIACPGDCGEVYAAGTVVTLTPKANSGFEFQGWAGACTGGGACAPTVITVTTVKAAFRRTAEPPASVRLRGDRDGDGVADGLDACPETPRGAALLRSGCVPTDLARGAVALRGALDEAAAKARLRLRGISGLARAARDLDRALGLADRGSELLESGDACPAASTLRGAASALDAATVRSAGLVRALRDTLTRELRPAGTDETTEKDLRLAGLSYRQRQVEQVAAAARELSDLAGTACRRLGKRFVVSGRVLATDDARGLVTLVGGRVLQLPAARRGGAVWEGGRVKIVARAVSDGPAVVESVEAVVNPKLGDLTAKPCISLLIAPAQDFSKSEPILHHPRGYESFGALWLEEGMRVAATPPCAKATPGFRYSLSVEISGPGKPTPVADDLTATDAPVPLPLGASNTTWTLKATERRQGNDCPPPGSKAQARTLSATAKSYPCPLVVLGTTTYKVLVRAPGSYAIAIYERTVFDLESNAFDSGKVIALGNVHSSIPSASFEANGYAIVGTQSAGFLSKIQKNQQFAVWQESWYGFPLLFPLDTIGVDHYAGLVWPRVVGTRNGKPFRYRAALPPIVTDLLPNCLPALDCFYRLPWKFGTSETTVQGNGPKAFSHTGTQQFAFDFVHDNGETIYATRGGVVGDVVESNSKTFSPCADNNNNGIAGDEEDKKADGPSNFVRIDHQDGTYSYYAHVQKNSVVPNEGDVVARGAAIATVGNVGRSCGPHLHYQVAIDNTNTLYGQTKQICFETETSSCSIPKTNDVLVSTNA